MSKSISVVDYAIARLAKAGVKDIFGLPGDFAFPWDDAVAKNKDMNWRGASNELNAAYAADGYARVNGVGALSTTYAVGEMSALAGVMGAKAEKVPVFHLVGMPSMRMQKQPHKILHHTLGDGVYQNFINIGGSPPARHASTDPGELSLRDGAGHQHGPGRERASLHCRCPGPGGHARYRP